MKSKKLMTIETSNLKDFYSLHNIWSIEDLQRHYENKKGVNGHSFTPGAMAFFKSKLQGTVYPTVTLIYFVSSEKGPDDKRKYSVRSYDPSTGNIDTVGEFQAYNTAQSANLAAYRLAMGGIA